MKNLLSMIYLLLAFCFAPLVLAGVQLDCGVSDSANYQVAQDMNSCVACHSESEHKTQLLKSKDTDRIGGGSQNLQSYVDSGGGFISDSASAMFKSSKSYLEVGWYK